MRMTFGEAAKLVLNQFGIGVLWVQLGLWIGLVLVTMMGFGSIALSAWGFGWVTMVFLVFYLIFVLGVIYSPITWAGISGTAIVAGQPGGEENLSLNDGINVLKRWAPNIHDKMGLVLVFWVPVWFLYTILFSTKGYVQENAFLFILIPTLIYFAKDEWPTGKLVLRIAGYGLVAIAVYVAGATVFSTLNRVTVDPAVQEMQAYHDKQASNLKKDQQELVQLLINKVNETGVASLTPKQLKEWRYFEEQREKQTPAGRVTTLATQVATDVANAKPSDPNWWQAHWYLPVLGVGVIIALAILYRLFVRTAGGPDAGAHASAETSAKKGVSLWGIACLAFLGWCAFSYATATGWPGEYIANYGYTHQTKLYLKNLSDQKVCDQGLQPGTWHVSFPREIYLAHPSQNGRYDKVGGFYLLHKGEMLRKSFLEDVWVNGVRTGWNETVTVGPDHCFTVTVNISPEVKAEAVMYGNPQCWSEHQQSCQASGVPRTAEVNLMFSQKAPIR